MTIHYSDDDSTKIAEMTVSGRITMADYEAVAAPLEKFAERHGVIRFLEIVREFGGFDPSVLLPGIQFDFRMIPQISHVAVVSDLGWISPIVKATGAVMPFQMRVFDLADEAAAREWLRTADRTPEAY